MSSAEAKLIINADDLGLSACVNQGVETAYREGILTSASLLANTPGFEGGVEVARNNPGLAIGVHLNILRGRPVASPADVASLLHGNYFRLQWKELRSACRNAKVFVEIKHEYRAQVERILKAGITPTHIDSEKHHAIWPSIADILQELAQEYRIPATRSLREPVAFGFRFFPWPGIAALCRSVALRCLATTLQVRRRTLQPQHFFGQLHIGRVDAPMLKALFKHCPPGIHELMVHPGAYDPEEMNQLTPEIGESWIHAARPKELAALVDPSVVAALAASPIEPVSYRALANF